MLIHEMIMLTCQGATSTPKHCERASTFLHVSIPFSAGQECRFSCCTLTNIYAASASQNHEHTKSEQCGMVMLHGIGFLLFC